MAQFLKNSLIDVLDPDADIVNLVKTENLIFSNPNVFSEFIERLSYEMNESLFDSLVFYMTEQEADEDQIATLMSKSLKEKLTIELGKLRMIKASHDKTTVEIFRE